MKKIVVFGPGPMFKGGIANYNTSLAKALDRRGDVKVHIVSWTQQYPAIIPRDFIDRRSKTDQLEGTEIRVNYVLNYNNILSWNRTVRLIRQIKPELVIFQWSIAIQGIPLAFVARKLRRAGIKVAFDLHFVKQKENSKIDRVLTRLGVGHSDLFIVHAMKTVEELRELFPRREFEVVSKQSELSGKGTGVIKLYHPVYDMFVPQPDFDRELEKKNLGLKKHVFLFFGFIRKYKGLHNAIRAFARVTAQRDDVSLLVVGESFWHTLDSKKFSTRLKKALFGIAKSLFLKKQDDEGDYRPLELVDELRLQDQVVVFNDFVPNEQVYKYFQVSDSILLFYETATPSGVESIAYNFKLPILATRVGHFPETVKDGFNGYLAEPDNIVSMSEAMLNAINKPIPPDHVAETSREMSWDNYASAIMG
jgi:glycosyltransferase involved in cell wall biosynthesis